MVVSGVCAWWFGLWLLLYCVDGRFVLWFWVDYVSFVLRFGCSGLGVRLGVTDLVDFLC